MIMSLGVLLVVLTGGIDLSVGSVFSLTGMVTALCHGKGEGDDGEPAGMGSRPDRWLINGVLVTGRARALSSLR